MHLPISPARGAVAGLIALLAITTADAHVPTLSDGTATTPETAITFDDIQISRVIYHEITTAAPRIWLTFTVDEPQALKIRFAIPRIDRFADYRPAFALLGPELPAISLPFATPNDLGGQAYETGAVSNPEVYDEIFTGTQAWVLWDGTVDLPAAGQYYLVAYHPTDAPGKLWLAPGRKEVFTADDVATLSDDIAAIRAFHEVGPDAAPPCFLVALAGLIALRAIWSQRLA